MPLGPIVPGSYVDITADAAPPIYPKLQAPSATMLVKGADLQALTLAVMNIQARTATIKATNWTQYAAPVTAGEVLVYDETHKTIVATGHSADTALLTNEAVDSGDWTSCTFTTPQTIDLSWGVCNPAGVMLLGGINVQKLYKSSDGGFNFSTSSLPASLASGTQTGVWDAAHATFLTAGFGGLATSPDGVTWTNRAAYSGNVSNTNRGLATDGLGKVVSINFGTGVAVTTDGGVTWATHAIAGIYRAIGYNAVEAIWILVGDQNVATSPDGATWTVASPGTSFYLQDIACDGALAVCIVRHGTGSGGIVYSRDSGQSWHFIFLRDFTGGANNYKNFSIAHFRNAFYVGGFDASAPRIFRSIRAGAETLGGVG